MIYNVHVYMHTYFTTVDMKNIVLRIKSCALCCASLNSTSIKLHTFELRSETQMHEIQDNVRIYMYILNYVEFSMCSLENSTRYMYITLFFTF